MGAVCVILDFGANICSIMQQELVARFHYRMSHAASQEETNRGQCDVIPEGGWGRGGK